MPTPLLILTLACSGTVDTGSVRLCASDGLSGGDDVDLDRVTTVTAVGVTVDDCTVGWTFTDPEGETTSVGLRVEDADGADITPDPGLVEGDAVDLAWRYRLVWGDVAGLVLTGDDGLVLAVEEGGWGGALSDTDTPGLTVTRGEEPVAEEKTSCEPIEGYAITFAGDDSVTLTPVATGTVTVDGHALDAHAVRATEWGESPRCEMTDTTGMMSWVVVRP